MVVIPPAPPAPPPPRAVEWNEKLVGILGLLFCAGVIVYLLRYGRPESRLDETQATMAWMVGGSILLGILGFQLLALRSQNQTTAAYYRAAAAASPPPAVSSTQVVSPD
ncbi:MAG: hypothetical protein AB7O45_13235 [Alphaproteobacteria bacterium]